jgi:hypothetical protein
MKSLSPCGRLFSFAIKAIGFTMAVKHFALGARSRRA